MAVVWRMVWGLIRLASSEGILAWALRIYRSTNVWMPKRVMGRLQRLRKTRAEGERPAMTTVSFSNGVRPQRTTALFAAFTADLH